ncbi:MAG: hypothetical protein MK116_03835 [Phycisphaerales bacterium]|nr:hypothetical protein [Phycisphaerales bacterium]
MGSSSVASAEITDDLHGDLVANSLDWPVGEVTPFNLRTDSFDNPGGGSQVVYDDVITFPGMSWMRLYFGPVELGRGSYIRVTSLRDGEQQRLDAQALAMWSNTSAYFNGDALRVELVAGPFSTDNVLDLEFVAAEPVHQNRGDNCGICGSDSRTPTSNDNFARLMPVGCSATIYNEASCFVTAGHCLTNATVLHFNVPDSSSNCSTNQPPVADQFPVTSSDGVDAGVGADYGAMTSGTNSEGQTAYERYGTFIPLASSVPNSGNIVITGYGVDDQCTRSQTLQTDSGSISSVDSNSISYEVDVTYGNSGSSIVYNNTIIGVVTHCSYGCENYGTRIDLAAFANLITDICEGGGGDPGDAPENDDCANAILIGTGLTDFSTTGGSTSVDSYDDSLCTGTYLGAMNADVWFAYSPSSSGTLTVSTCDLVNFDTDLVVYQGTCGNKSQVACNGDGSGCSGYSSSLTVDVSGGSSYLIRVGGWDASASGSGQLNLDLEGAPDPTGACCVGSSCSIDTEADCGSAGGTYQGDNSNCGGDPCFVPPATGACCLDGNCSIATQDDCGASGGDYQGDDSNCSGDPCFTPPATGACCLDGNCSIGTEADCGASGGAYQGDDSDCSGDPCFVPPANGACCLDGNCSIGTEADCNSAGGAYQGDDSDCSGDPCFTPPATGGCCVGTSCSTGTADDCAAAGGSYLGDGSDCSGSACEPSEVQFVHSMVGSNLVDDPQFNWTVDVYVSVPNGARVDAVAGNGSLQKLVTSTGLFYQSVYGGPLSTDVNPAFFEFDPNLEWDSRLTIGAIDSTGNPFDANNVGSVGIDWTDFENGFGVATNNGLWYVLPSEPQGEGQTFIGTDCQEREGVLLARLTTFGQDSEINFQALIQGRDSASQAWQEELDLTFGYVETLDCNANGVSDTCDIANGTSTDANGNGVPDECDNLCAGDYDGNGVTNIDDILTVIGDWGNPYTVEDLLAVLDDYGCGG